MAKALIGALALSTLPSALAFRNTSPFFLFSTDRLDGVKSDHIGIAQAGDISALSHDLLRDCPSSTYFIVRQDGVSSADYANSRSAPRLGRHLGGDDTDIKRAITITEVVDEFDARDLSHFIETRCKAEVVEIDGGRNRMDEHRLKGTQLSPRPKDGPPRIIKVNFPAPPATDRQSVLSKYDAFLEYLIISEDSSPDYTVIYTTTAQTEEQAKSSLQTQHTYEMDDPFGETVHMELKRDAAFHRRAKSKTEGGLFEKYQYLSPGLFMGLGVTIPLFLILYVGIMAIAGLEVSYFAFSKEMGPTAQKKQ